MSGIVGRLGRASPADDDLRLGVHRPEAGGIPCGGMILDDPDVGRIPDGHRFLGGLSLSGLVAMPVTRGQGEERRHDDEARGRSGQERRGSWTSLSNHIRGHLGEAQFIAKAQESLKLSTGTEATVPFRFIAANTESTAGSPRSTSTNPERSPSWPSLNTSSGIAALPMSQT